MPSSFINEHTAEFILVPMFSKILEQNYRPVIPIYYWASREGGILARKCLQDVDCLIVAFYARRPKVHYIQQEHIEVKFNESLFSHARLLEQIGVKVFAGVPLISDLKHLHSEPPCAFFNINPHGNECILHINKFDVSTTFESDSILKVDPLKILSIIAERPTYQHWDKFIEADKKGRFNPYNSTLKGIYGQLYKPVYFLLPC